MQLFLLSRWLRRTIRIANKQRLLWVVHKKIMLELRLLADITTNVETNAETNAGTEYETAFLINGRWGMNV
jgi:hypothetical protein